MSTSREIALNSTDGRHVLWLIRSGESGEVVDECVANGVAAVRYATVGDVRERTPAQVLKELTRATNRTDYETLAQRLLDFAERMHEGDYVVTSDGARRQLVVGRVAGLYEWRENSPIPGMRHLRPVEWLGRIDWDDLDEPAVKALVKYPRTILEVTDPTLVAIGARAEAGELLPVTPPTTARRTTSTRTSASRAAGTDGRLCQECFLWKNASQFDADSMICREHTE